ncbi:YchJ family protein [Marinobacter sp.]|uniref:YchJ family protein n=1 Tax=Marinobacter sp. TaxID=50741 RepID=UPI00356A02B4
MSEMPGCPCGSGYPYQDCCRRYHQGVEVAPTPEALMRSRYTAFVLKLTGYLLSTWHPDTRPASLPLDDSPDWTALQVLSSGEQGNRGQVHFRAVYRLSGSFGYLEEASDFVREDGRWFYVSGETREGHLDPGRNDRCPCGSGRKFKACCLNRQR